MKKRKIVFISLGAFLGLVLICFIFLLFFGRAFPTVRGPEVIIEQEKYCLPMSEDVYYRQTYNNCGPYSAMAVINVLTGKKLDPEKLAADTKWRIQKNLTLPQGVLTLLKDNNIYVKDYVLKGNTSEAKLNWLKYKIWSGNPVILLLKIDNYLHYVTVIGYDEKGFMIYDSMQPKNPQKPGLTIIDWKNKKEGYSGNTYCTNTRLLKLWDDGGVGIFLNNYAIACGTEKFW